jgi:NAD(P)-dependent dehydrogenase (short-subunit alcohol dehydrogenase family)
MKYFRGVLPMKQWLNDKSAVITGSGAGIGKAIAIAMAEQGASIVINDIIKELADKAVEEIVKGNGNAIVNTDTVATMDGGRNIIKTAIDHFGKIDILVNCAGFSRDIPSVDVTEGDWNEIIDVNLKGHFTCIQPAIKEMIKQKSGRIINFSSRAGFMTSYAGLCALPYAAAKAGIVGITGMLAAELRQHGITVNAILPSAVTPGFSLSRPLFGGGETKGPEYVAPIVVYLATDKAENITGQYIYSSSGDIMIFDTPLQFDGPNKLIRKMDNWTIEELHNVIPLLI